MYNNNRKLGSLRTYDPRVKLYILCIYFIMCIISWKIIPVCITLAAGLIIVFLTGHKLRYLWDLSNVAILIELLIGLFLIFFLKPQIIVMLVLRVMIFTFVYNSVIRCFKQVELLDGLTSGFGLGAGMSRKVYSIMQFYPRLEKQKKRVRNALLARGVNPDEGGILTRFITDITLSIPNYQNTYDESVNREITMEMRDYTSSKRRKRVYEMKMSIVDEIVLIVGIILILAVLFFQIF
ncbi:MAG TPA: hypothetical protein DEO83_01100 [Lachnospiraceae bacterium]|nr:hypothetical protein [Lachnospiraceae bacterium]